MDVMDVMDVRMMAYMVLPPNPLPSIFRATSSRIMLMTKYVYPNGMPVA